MSRIFHRVTRMVAWNINKKTLLFTEEDFVDLVNQFFPDLSPLDSVEFKMIVLKNIGFDSKKDDYPTWEKALCERLLKAYRDGNLPLNYVFTGTDAKMYLEDYLEAYRVNYLQINYAIGDISNSFDEIINISLKTKQTIVQKILNKYGDHYGEINILKSKVVGISGSPVHFDLSVGDQVYKFDASGVHSL